MGLIHDLLLILRFLSMGEGDGILGVVVECVDIWKNISSEGGCLAQY